MKGIWDPAPVWGKVAGVVFLVGLVAFAIFDGIRGEWREMLRDLLFLIPASLIFSASLIRRSK